MPKFLPTVRFVKCLLKFKTYPLLMDSNFIYFTCAIIPEETTVNTLVQYGSGNFEIVEECEILMNGILRYSQENIVPTNYEYVNLDDCILFSNSEICEVFKQYSMEFSDQLCNISRIYITPKGKLFLILKIENC